MRRPCRRVRNGHRSARARANAQRSALLWYAADSNRDALHELFADFFKEADGTTYVQTGDIPAMWLRDSAAQTIPYIRFVETYSELRPAFWGVIERDAKNILTDPYAEAF